MKRLIPSVLFILWIIALISPGVIQADQKALMTELENVDAVQAVALANQWRWTDRNIKTAVDAQKIVFKFPDGRVKTVPLPADKMLVAVAPYIRKTHT